MAQMRLLLRQFQPVWDGLDSIVWIHGSEGCFSVKDFFSIIRSLRFWYGPREQFDLALELVWRLDVPYKVKTFRWRCFINKLPTKDLLANRCILSSSNTSCIFCSNVGESALHSLLCCHNMDLVWRDMVEWAGFHDYKVLNFNESFLKWFSNCKRALEKKRRECCGWPLAGQFGWLGMWLFLEMICRMSRISFGERML